MEAPALCTIMALLRRVQQALQLWHQVRIGDTGDDVVRSILAISLNYMELQGLLVSDAPVTRKIQETTDLARLSALPIHLHQHLEVDVIDSVFDEDLATFYTFVKVGHEAFLCFLLRHVENATNKKTCFTLFLPMKLGSGGGTFVTGRLGKENSEKLVKQAQKPGMEPNHQCCPDIANFLHPPEVGKQDASGTPFASANCRPDTGGMPLALSVEPLLSPRDPQMQGKISLRRTHRPSSSMAYSGYVATWKHYLILHYTPPNSFSATPAATRTPQTAVGGIICGVWPQHMTSRQSF